MKLATFLRFGNINPDPTAKPVSPLFKVAEKMGLTTFIVNKLILAKLKGMTQHFKKWSIRKLDDEHLDFLISDETLRKWRPYSLRTRVLLFHRQFPDRFISVSRLRQIYQLHGIGFKEITITQALTPKQLEGQTAGRSAAFKRIIDLQEAGATIVYADEAVFTSGT